MIRQAHGSRGFLPYRLWRLQRLALDVMLINMFAIAGCAQRNSLLAYDSPTIDAVLIYIGVIPAELVQYHTIALGHLTAFHGGRPKYGSSHNLVFALSGAKTGVRIADVRMNARPYESIS